VPPQLQLRNEIGEPGVLQQLKLRHNTDSAVSAEGLNLIRVKIEVPAAQDIGMASERRP
jgi:hypothetical protein